MGVTGPDEYNAVVNNNAYTNLMARENLRYAAEVVESLRTAEPDAHKEVVHRTALEASEVEAWRAGSAPLLVDRSSTQSTSKSSPITLVNAGTHCQIVPDLSTPFIGTTRIRTFRDRN
jgi:Glycosyl hydrolase family 65 central catalytic domain